MTSLRAASLASFVALLALSPACSSSRADGGAQGPSSGAAEASGAPTAQGAASEGDRCRARVKEIEALPALPGAPGYEANRIAILGRARGEPMVFTRAPK